MPDLFSDLPEPKSLSPLLWFSVAITGVIIAHDYLLPHVPIDFQRAVPGIAETCTLALAVLVFWSRPFRTFLSDNLIRRDRNMIAGLVLLVLLAVFFGFLFNSTSQGSSWRFFVDHLDGSWFMTDNDAWLAVAYGDLWGTVTGWWRYAITANVLAPIWETIALVAIVFPLLRRVMSPAGAMITAGTLFSLMHYPQAHAATGFFVALPDWSGYVILLFDGMLMIGLYCWTRSLVIPILWHAVHNAGITLLIFRIGWCTSC